MRSSSILLQPTAVIALLASASGAVPETPQFRRPECGDRTSDKFFFSEGLVGAKTAQFDQDEFARHWYSGALRTASEPSLSCDPAPRGETYRFLRLRPFDTPMFVRVEARDDGGVLWAGIMGSGSRKMFRTVRRNLTRAEWTKVTAGLGTLGFWKLPTRVVSYVRDDEEWVIEGRKGSQYHVVSRGALNNGPCREFGFAVLKLAGLDPTAGMYHY